mmetsp:Transcript_33186/g.34488  ORF Transcript_33186/g.34488 Transcript_33186/m.34488 type:complete len:345 (-) Transcript_33186:11-1045(-)
MSGEQDIDCRAIWDSIEKDTDELLKKDLSERLKDDMVKTINDRVNAIHSDIDKKGEDFINRVIESFNLEKESEKELKEGKVPVKSRNQKKSEELRRKRLDQIESLTNEVEKNYQKKMEDLVYSVEQMISKCYVIDGSCDMFNNSPLDKLIGFGKDEVNIKVERKIGSLLKGKNGFDLSWNAKVNNSTYSTVDKNDSTHLKVHGTTCYTYYQTTPKFTDEDFTLEIEYKVNQSDNYFYLGLINSSVVPTSHCMCCTIANGFYIQPNGDIVLNSKRTTNSKLSSNKSQVNNVIFRVSLSEKSMWITMNDKEEQGPFKLVGSSFTFVSGSCNSVNGYVKILNSFYGC